MTPEIYLVLSKVHPPPNTRIDPLGPWVSLPFLGVGRRPGANLGLVRAPGLCAQLSAGAWVQAGCSAGWGREEAERAAFPASRSLSWDCGRIIPSPWDSAAGLTPRPGRLAAGPAWLPPSVPPASQVPRVPGGDLCLRSKPRPGRAPPRLSLPARPGNAEKTRPFPSLPPTARRGRVRGKRAFGGGEPRGALTREPRANPEVLPLDCALDPVRVLACPGRGLTRPSTAGQPARGWTPGG